MDHNNSLSINMYRTMDSDFRVLSYSYCYNVFDFDFKKCFIIFNI